MTVEKRGEGGRGEKEKGRRAKVSLGRYIFKGRTANITTREGGEKKEKGEGGRKQRNEKCLPDRAAVIFHTY